jgi:hypothetical protein
MLTRFVRQCLGWEVWSTIERDDPVRMDRIWDPWRMFQDGYLVGQWTGPKRDHVCVLRCDSVDEAQRCLAPRAPTITLATLASLLIRAENERRRGPQRAIGTRRGAAVLDNVVPLVKRRYAREIAMVSERLAISRFE